MLWFASLIFVVITAPLWLPLAVGAAAIAVVGVAAIVVIVVPPIVGWGIAQNMDVPPVSGALLGCLASTYFGREVWLRYTGKRWRERAMPMAAKAPSALRAIAPQGAGLADLQQAVIVQRAEKRRIEAERATETARHAAMKKQSRREVEQRWPEWCAKFDEAVSSVNVVLNELRLPSIERAKQSVSTLNRDLSQIGGQSINNPVVPPAWEPVRRSEWEGYHLREVRCEDGELPEHFGANWDLHLEPPVPLRLAISEGGVHIGGQGSVFEGLPFHGTSVQDIADAISLEIQEDILEHGEGSAS